MGITIGTKTAEALAGPSGPYPALGEPGSVLLAPLLAPTAAARLARHSSPAFCAHAAAGFFHLVSVN